MFRVCLQESANVCMEKCRFICAQPAFKKSAHCKCRPLQCVATAVFQPPLGNIPLNCFCKKYILMEPSCQGSAGKCLPVIPAAVVHCTSAKGAPLFSSVALRRRFASFRPLKGRKRKKGNVKRFLMYIRHASPAFAMEKVYKKGRVVTEPVAVQKAGGQPVGLHKYSQSIER